MNTTNNLFNLLTEDTLTSQVTTFVETLQAHTGGPQGYRLRRILLTNFWLYGQQEFEFPHGRLFLAGENASGKSTVLTAALPLGLDGDLRPNRIDTFGGRERHIEYYVLGGSESATPFSHERRTAYIALEFEWCDPDTPPIAPSLRQQWERGEQDKARFLTIGLSLAGNINASDRIRPMRFLITDGSRLGHELHTVYEAGSRREKHAYDQARFRQQLEGHGIICDSQAEYERQVARYLFGFNDVKDFQKLIQLLLVLRRPNLSSELNFSRVHDYLKQSLRKIPTETSHRVIGTIERIDSIQSEIERIQEAYDAAERLHRARQSLALVRAQLAAGEYLIVQQAEDTIQSRVTKLRKELTAADNERKRADSRSQIFQTEQHQVNGQIKALEASEGLQVAKQLTSARERAQESEAQMHLQEQSLEAARRSIRENQQSLERQRLRFEKTKTESVTHLHEIRSIAADESYWEVAAFQLEEALSQVNTISMDAPFAPEIPLGVTSLIGVESDERIAWLHHLEELHRQREKLETQVHYARTQETSRFQELDESRRRFEAVQDRGYETQQNLNKTLEQFATLVDTSDEIVALDGLAPSQSLSVRAEDDESSGSSVVEQFAAALKGYRQTVETLESELADTADQIQGELNELQLLTGSKNHELAEATARYEQKLSEPEFTPLRPPRHTQARVRLAEQGIAALPLYALLDFAPNIDSESDEAGRIEYILEDAGLLDALVVPPSQVTAADVLLAAEGLGDCLLDTGTITRGSGANIASGVGVAQGHTQFERATQGSPPLRFDTAVNDNLDTNHTDWEVTTATILAAIDYHPDVQARFSMNDDGTWTHGLLTGRAGGGTARCIGKATRLRVRQRELDALNEQRTKLEAELNWLHHQLAAYEQQLVQLQEQQTQLRKVLPNSGLEEIYAELVQTKLALDEVRGKYQKVRQQTQEARQSYNTLIAQLERESKNIAPLASDSKRVQIALMGVIKLKNQARSLQLQLASMINIWQECQKTRETLETAQANETNVARLYERVRYQAAGLQAEVEELQHIAQFADAEELSQRLRALREHSETLVTQLDAARASYIRADERANNAEANLVETETLLQQAQAERLEKQTHFIALLTVYPVERLATLQPIAKSGDYVRTAQNLLGDSVQEGELSLHKERLEEEYRDTYNALSRTFNRELPLLMEYGPDLDAQGHIQFLNESKSRPVELLEILSERIEMQKTLLGQEERQLFEDFLLQEIAEAIRTHILEAEEWVQQINTVLSGLPMIGEHYALAWKPLAEYDPAQLGSHLARHYRLLRKPAQTLTAEETETLMGAFRREIESVRLRQQEDAGMNFLDALERVFDYREWFHFDVLVTSIGGQRQRLTDRIAGTRSGAEQLFALYVPLFAALAALYRSAAPGAPRLLALDEAFDKVSVANTQRIMEFLVSQDFQWIMTGPQISGTGAKIPACARYLMIHEKGSLAATASASLWSDSQALQPN